MNKRNVRYYPKYKGLENFYNDMTELSAKMHSFSKQFDPKRRDELEEVSVCLSRLGSVLWEIRRSMPEHPFDW